MKKVLFINDSTENRITYYHLLLFLLALPFDRFYSSILLVSLLLHTIIFLKREQVKSVGSETLIFVSAFIISLLAMGWSSFTASGIDIVTRQLAILFFPILFSVTALDINKYKRQLMLAFAAGCTLTVAYLFYDALHIISFNHLPLKHLFSQAFVNHNFSLPINLHATYLSMMLVCAIIFLMKEIEDTPDKKRKITWLICSLVLTAGLIQLGSKAVLIAFLLILNLAFPLMHLQGRARKRFMLFSIMASLLLIAFIFSVDVFRERFMVSLEDDLVETNRISKSNSRAERWGVAAEIIRQSPAIGNGTGSETVLLKEAYFSKKMYGPYLSSLNAHNQFLSLLISAGIIGLLLYLATLYWGFRRAIFNRDILGLSFMILVTIVSFSEDMLYVNKGIFFYSFFFSFFLLKKAGVKYVFRETTTRAEYRLVK